MGTRSRFISVTEARAGMRLAEPIQLVSHGRLTLSLAQGHLLTPQCVDQLLAHGAECLLVTEEDLRTPEQRAHDVDAMTRRVQQVFASADLSDPTMAALFAQVLAYRSGS